MSNITVIEPNPEAMSNDELDAAIDRLQDEQGKRFRESRRAEWSGLVGKFIHVVEAYGISLTRDIYIRVDAISVAGDLIGICLCPSPSELGEWKVCEPIKVPAKYTIFTYTEITEDEWNQHLADFLKPRTT